jgi:outer membrane protein assembly factor BamE
MKLAAAFPLLLVAALAGCGIGVPRVPGITPYRIEIQQGNYVAQEAVAQLKRGMTKDQVRGVLGFHANRWDYVYYRELADGTREQRKLVVHFDKDEKLASLDGDVVGKGAQ